MKCRRRCRYMNHLEEKSKYKRSDLSIYIYKKIPQCKGKLENLAAPVRLESSAPWRTSLHGVHLRKL